MIEEIKDFDVDDIVWDWDENVKEKIVSTMLDDKETWGGHISLHINKFEDSIEVHADENTFDVTIIEEMYETSDYRDNNIRFIKLFVEHEMPYYQYDRVEEFSIDADEHGFTLHFKPIDKKAIPEVEE
jgi:hypothetical protein